MDSKKHNNILIIDDDIEIHSILKLMLDFWGFKTYSAMDAYEGIASALRNTPHLIFLDIDMPEINGEKTLKLLKTIDETKKIPTLVLSGSIDKNVIILAKKLGAADFITKPFSHEMLLERLLNHLPADIVQRLNLNAKKKKVR